MHRSAKAWSEGRNIRKLLAKTSWYKERDPEAAGEAGTDSDNEPFDRFLKHFSKKNAPGEQGNVSLGQEGRG